jgi:hypothetical protein
MSLILELCLGRNRFAQGRNVGKERKNEHRITKKHLGIYLDSSRIDGHSNKPCKPRGIHGSGNLLMVESVWLVRSIASSDLMLKDSDGKSC